MLNNINVTPVPLYSKGHLHAVGYPTNNSKNVKLFWGNVELSSAPDLHSVIGNAYIGIRLMSPKFEEWLTIELRKQILKELLDMSYLIDDGLHRNKEGLAKNLKLGISWYLVNEALTKDPLDLRSKNMLVTQSLFRIDPDLKKLFNSDDDRIDVSYNFKFYIGANCFDSSNSFKNVPLNENFKQLKLSLIRDIASGIISKKRNMVEGDPRLTIDMVNTIMSYYNINPELLSYEELINWFNTLNESENKAKEAHNKYIQFNSSRPGRLSEACKDSLNKLLEADVAHSFLTGHSKNPLQIKMDSECSDPVQITEALKNEFTIKGKTGEVTVNDESVTVTTLGNINIKSNHLPSPARQTTTSRVQVIPEQVKEGVSIIDTTRLYKSE